MKPSMTERVYRYIAKRIAAGEPPSRREIARACGMVSHSQGVLYHLKILIEQKRITLRKKVSRGIRLPRRKR